MGTFKASRLRAETITLPGGDTVAVRGLSLSDITFLVNQHKDVLRSLYDQVAGNPESLTSGDAGVIGSILAESAPIVAATAIALAADELDAVDIVMKLPFPVQVDALDKIGRLTFEMEGGPKKVIETVIRVIQASIGPMQEIAGSTRG